MVCITHFVVSLFILVLPFEISGFTIKRDSKAKSPPIQLNGMESPSTIAPTHNVPLNSVPSRSLSVVKREVMTDDGRVSNLYDPGLMIMSKRSAAALNKLMSALRSSFDEPASNSFENASETATQDNGRFPTVGFRTSGSGFNSGTYTSNAVQRRGSKDRKVFLRCYFNAVSCF
ncbi:hypothetical protein Ocin01_03284 [Orchesella cincta]|uniref:Uncharacterized protein n=1 Tax=Orchesella cincta TaxID=48709 RepID=A0A1D2NDQ6_ORCCI|nr:hypothetical protein Ocin01_03284 [Orchesella cincta]